MYEAQGAALQAETAQRQFGDVVDVGLSSTSRTFQGGNLGDAEDKNDMRTDVR